VAKEELDAVSDLRYAWKKLRKCASEASDQLAALQARARLSTLAKPLVQPRRACALQTSEPAGWGRTGRL